MEKSLFAQSAEIKGKEKKDEFAASFQFTPVEEALKQTRGMLFFLIRVKTAAGMGDDLARNFFETFKEDFYSQKGGNLTALEGALETLKTSLKDQGVQAAAVVANLWGSVLYVAKLEAGGVILVRNETAKTVDFTKVASGVLINKDTVILADQDFLTNVDLALLGKSLASANFDEAVKEFGTNFKEKEGLALWVRLSIQEPIEQIQEVLVADLDKIGEQRPSWRPPSLNLSLNFDSLKNAGYKVATFVSQAGPPLKKRLIQAAQYLTAPWLPRPPGDLEGEASRKRKRIVQIIFLLVLILLVSVGGRLAKNSLHELTGGDEKRVAALETKLTDAERLKNIDPKGASRLLTEAEEQLSNLNSKDPKIVSLKEKLVALTAEINKIYYVDLDTFVDLATIKGSVKAASLKLAGNLFVLDIGTFSIYKVDSVSKKPSILVSERQDLQNFAAHPDFLYLQSKDAIEKIDTRTASLKRLAGRAKSWKRPLAAEIYRANFYLLDQEAKEIWKYAPSGEGLAGPSKYFAAPPSEVGASFAIDGNIWLATKGNITKFFGGKQAAFEVKNAPVGFSEVSAIYTKEETGNLYVLDKGQKGIFVIDKGSGSYLAMYKNDKLAQGASFAVDEAKKQVFVLIENTVHSFNLK